MNSDKILKIDLLSEAKQDINNLSEFAEKIGYIPLQTTQNSLIDDMISKVICINNRIFIQNNNEILCFTLEGEFLFKTVNSGRGPEEYISIYDFDVSNDNKKLILLSRKKILIYHIDDKNLIFQKVINLKEPVPWRMSFVHDSSIFCSVPPWSGSESTLSFLIDINGDTINQKSNCYSFLITEKGKYQALNELLVYSVDNIVCFKEEFSDTVFFIDRNDNAFKPRLIMNTNGTLITPEMRGGSASIGNNTLYISNIFETSRYVFYWFGTKDKKTRILYDKYTNTINSLNDEGAFHDDLSGGPDFKIDFLRNYCSNGKLFSFIEALRFKKYIDSEEFKNCKVIHDANKSELIKIANSLNENDNPVLVILTPKK